MDEEAAFLGKEKHTVMSAINNIYFDTFDLFFRCCHGESRYRCSVKAAFSRAERRANPLLADESNSVQLLWNQQRRGF